MENVENIKNVEFIKRIIKDIIISYFILDDDLLKELRKKNKKEIKELYIGFDEIVEIVYKDLVKEYKILYNKDISFMSIDEFRNLEDFIFCSIENIIY